jgi:hypothetical protein
VDAVLRRDGTVVYREATTALPQIVVIQHFDDEVKRIVPAK